MLVLLVEIASGLVCASTLEAVQHQKIAVFQA